MGYSKVDPELKRTIKNLSFIYKEEPQPELLLRIPNTFRHFDYTVRHETEEFTSVCPLNVSQPDHAKITVEFQPREHLVELKSLKFFLTSFRDVEIFHEQVTPYILEALTNLLEPKWLFVTGEFTTRGGLRTTVQAKYVRDE